MTVPAPQPSNGRANGKFVKGVSGNPGGSLDGMRKVFSAEVLRIMGADFRAYGAAAVAKVRKNQPAAYLKICALLVPKEFKVEHTSGVKGLSDEQLSQAIEAIQ